MARYSADVRPRTTVSQPCLRTCRLGLRNEAPAGPSLAGLRCSCRAAPPQTFGKRTRCHPPALDATRWHLGPVSRACNRVQQRSLTPTSKPADAIARRRSAVRTRCGPPLAYACLQVFVSPHQPVTQLPTSVGNSRPKQFSANPFVCRKVCRAAFRDAYKGFETSSVCAGRHLLGGGRRRRSGDVERHSDASDDRACAGKTGPAPVRGHCWT